MESLSEISSRYQTDKAANTHYLANYEKYFSPLRNEPVKLLELGIFDGGSLLMWRDYFREGTIVGLDINVASIHDESGRIHLYQGEQQDKVVLDKVARETAPDGFDFIIDDCAHIGRLSRMSFSHLFFNHLKSGGIYVIEDWGTGYWNGWADGIAPRPTNNRNEATLRDRIGYRLSSIVRKNPSSSLTSALISAKRLAMGAGLSGHNAGMVGFVKELIDECGLDDIYHPKFGIEGEGSSAIAALHFSTSHVFVEKK